MSLIEEALRRVKDPVICPPQAAAVQTPHPPAAAEPSAPDVERPAAEAVAFDRPDASISQAAPKPWGPFAPGPPASSLPQTSSLVAVALSVLALTVVLIVGGAFWMGRTLNGGPAAVPVIRTARPTAPPGVMPETTPRTSTAPSRRSAFTLSGIVEGLGEPYAVINGMIVGVGEHVEGATLLEIANGEVRLRHGNGEETTLRVTP